LGVEHHDTNSTFLGGIYVLRTEPCTTYFIEAGGWR